MMSECYDAVSIRNQLRLLMSRLGMLQGLARVLVPRLVILFAVLLCGAVSVRSQVVKFGSPLVVLVV
jgi:hypothetical protein